MAPKTLQVSTDYRQILRIALPISLAMLVPQLNFLTNNIFLGHLDTESLAVASITGVYYLIFAGIGFGLNNGLQALISRRAGENDRVAIGRVFQQGVWISMLIAAFGILFTYLAAPDILKSVLANESHYNTAIKFLRIRIWGLPFLYLYQMRNALLVGTNNSKLLVVGTLAETVLNIFFDYVLIYGALGFTQMGFNGAAVASVIAEAAGILAIVAIVRLRGVDKPYQLFTTLRWRRAEAGQIAESSGPLVFQFAVSIVSWLIFYILIERTTNTTSMALSTAMRNVFSLAGVAIWALASTTNSMVSNVIGQGKEHEVMPLIWRITKLSFFGGGTIALLLALFPEPFLRIYGGDAAFIAQGVPLLRLIAGAVLLMSISAVWLYGVTGTGRSAVTFVIEVIAAGSYLVYIYFVLQKHRMGVWWGWSSEILYWVLMFGCAFAYIRSGRWRKKINTLEPASGK